MGLLGTYNNDYNDEITTPNCQTLQTIYPQTENDARLIYYNFGEKCKIKIKILLFF